MAAAYLLLVRTVSSMEMLEPRRSATPLLGEQEVVVAHDSSQTEYDAHGKGGALLLRQWFRAVVVVLSWEKSMAVMQFERSFSGARGLRSLVSASDLLEVMTRDCLCFCRWRFFLCCSTSFSSTESSLRRHSFVGTKDVSGDVVFSRTPLQHFSVFFYK
jgi:hypothetical protein